MNKATLIKALRKALTTTAGEGGDFLPTPLANYYINFVRDKNFLRQMFTTETMSSKTKDIPKVLSATKVYYQSSEATAGVKTGITSGTMQLVAKKFMAQADISEEVIEDAQGDMTGLVKNDFSESEAAAEEEAMLVGDPDHSPTTATESLADGTTWFTKDHRLIFYGLLTLAGDVIGAISDDTRAGVRVNAYSSDMSTAIAKQAKFNMGKYGRVMQNLVLILNPWSANQLLDDAKLVTVDKYGPNATIITGEIGKLYGKITVVDSAYMADGYGVMTHKMNPIIGDRRRVSIKSFNDITTDSRLFVITSRLDFIVKYKSALVQIFGLDEPDADLS